MELEIYYIKFLNLQGVVTRQMEGDRQGRKWIYWAQEICPTKQYLLHPIAGIMSVSGNATGSALLLE